MNEGGARERGAETRTHWQEWHDAYDDPGSSISRRLAVVQAELASALDASPPGELRLLSLCAGDARDVLGVLPGHPRSPDVRALLVDLDAELLGRAEERARRTGLVDVETVVADAGLIASFESMLPADVVVACGIFGNISATDIQATTSSLAAMLTPGGSVIWTRHRRPPDLTPAVRRWFIDAGFEERSFVAVPESLAAVGRCQLARPRDAGSLPARIFTFVGDGTGAMV